MSVKTFRKRKRISIIYQRNQTGRDFLAELLNRCTVFPFECQLQGHSLLSLRIFSVPGVFLPDYWTKLLISGIDKYRNSNSLGTIVEIGVGTGIVPICLTRAGVAIERYIGFDIDPLAVNVAQINARLFSLEDTVQLAGGDYLFDAEASLGVENGYADTVVANLPQIPALADGDLPNYFDYYPVSASLADDEMKFAMSGLGLLSELLTETRKRLAPGGAVILVVSGRAGRDLIEKLAESAGFSASYLDHAIVPQNPESDISPLVHIERSKIVDWIFYTDRQGSTQISARDAVGLIANGQQCYHDLFAVKFSLKG